MPLGLLARDSIQDLANIGRDQSAQGASSDHSVSALGKKGALASQPTTDPAPYGSAPPEAYSTEEKKTATSPSSSGYQNNTKDESSEATAPSSYGQYSGFRQDYYNDAYYYHDSYAPVYNERRGSGVGFWEGLLPCLFPWTSPQGRLEDDPDAENDSTGSSVKKASSKDEDEISNSSAIMGEKLSEKERMAVLNRLRLGQPDNTIQSDKPPSDELLLEKKKKGLLNGLHSYQTTKGGKIKGILKNTVTRPPPPQTSKKPVSSQDSVASSQRRALFPQYSGVGSFNGNSKGVNVDFAPMARVVTVKSRNDMTAEEKSDIWWQRMDYDDFRKTGRIITRAIAEGGSEIWLNSQTQLSKEDEECKDDPADVICATGDKWWHKFGHSRRGLEHVVSIDEGRQRQLNVKRAIQAVLEEQARQKLGRKVDPERLRHVSMQYTSWARDLALASGASDADAVTTQFAEDRKSREFYLLKIARNSPLQTDRHVPDFMQPAIQMASPRLAKKSLPSPHVLDANTAAQIRFRRKSLLKDESKQEETCEPVHDANTEGHKSTMAQRAAGFSADEEKVNMAAVLSGMGAVPQNKQVLSTA